MSFPTDAIAQAIAQEFHEVSEEMSPLRDVRDRYEQLGLRRGLLLRTWREYRHDDYPGMKDGNSVAELKQIYAQRPDDPS